MYNGLEMSQLLPYRWGSWKESISTNFQNSTNFQSFSQIVLKGVSLYCYTVGCLGSGCPICVVWWWYTAVLVASMHWLSGGGWKGPMPLQWCSPPVDLCLLLGFPPMVLKEVHMAECTPSPWSASGFWPGLSAMSGGLERSFCLCLGCMGDVFMGSMVNSSLLYSMGSLLCPWCLPGWLRVTGAVGLPAAWLCVAVVGSHQWCRSCSW